MSAELANPKKRNPVIQFTLFSDNKVGRLHEILFQLSCDDLHVVAISQQDSTDFAAIRFIVNYPEVARKCLSAAGYHFVETPVLAIEVKTGTDLKFITAALVEAEINIHYLYPFLIRPAEQAALVIHLEDPDLAASVLSARGIKVLDNSDISR